MTALNAAAIPQLTEFTGEVGIGASCIAL